MTDAGTIARNYCGACCFVAKKAGRPVRLTKHDEYPLCSICEAHAREGLVHYCPSNGTEFDIFLSRCYQCRHFTHSETEEPDRCAWGIYDKLSRGMFEALDSAVFWFQPTDLKVKGSKGELVCPAECLRFTSHDDPYGELGDPPLPDAEGQLYLGDVIKAPIPEMSHAK